MVHDICGIRICVFKTKVSIFTNSDMKKFHVEVDVSRPSCGLWLGSTIIAGGMLHGFGEGRCWDVVVQLFGYSLIDVNNNFIRVRKNLGPKVVLFNHVVRA